MEKYVPLIIGGVMFLFVLFGLFWGLIRGLKKSGFRAVWILTCAVILFFLTPLITKWLMNLNLGFLSIKVNGVPANSVRELIEVVISQIPNYGQILAKSPDTINLLIALVGLFINAFVYVICFWLVKIALWPLWVILSAIFIKKKNAKGEKKPKRRLFGGLVGGVTGLFVGATTLMPIMGVVGMVNEVEKDTYETYTKVVINQETGLKEEQEFKGGQITQLLGEDVFKYINAYNDSFVSKMLKYTGIEGINNAAYSGLSSATVGETRIVLKDEVKTALKTVGSITAFANLDFENLSKEQVAKIISSAKNVVNNVFGMNILNALGNNLYPIVMDEILSNPEFIVKLPATGSEVYDDAIVDAFTELKSVQFSDIKNEVIAVLDVAEILNNQGIIEKLANNQEGSFQDVTKLCTDETVAQINNKLFAMKSTSKLMPIMVNASLKYVAEMLEVEDFVVDEQHGNANAVKNLFTGITTTVFGVCNSLDLNSSYYITKTTLPLMGKLLDSVKSYEGLTSQNYKKLVDALENKLNKTISTMLDGINSSLIGVKDEILKSIKNLSEISNFENDFTKISSVYDNVVLVVEGLTAETTEIKLDKVGAVLDVFKQTQLFGSSINPIISAGLDYAKDQVPAEFSELTDVFEDVKANVPAVTSWEAELTKINEVVNVAGGVFDSANLKDAFLSEESTMLTDLGAALNTLNTTTLFNGQVKNIVKVLLGQVEKMEIDNVELLTTTLSEIETNIDNATTINWETEFATLKTLLSSLMDLADETATSQAVTDVGETFDDILKTNSVLITEDVIKTIVCTTIDQFAGDVESGSDLEVIITNIKLSINEQTGLSYKTELTALNSLFENITDIDTDSANFYAEFGQLLDSYDATYGYYHSVVVSSVRPDIVKLVINKVDTASMDSAMVTIVNKIKNNVDNLESIDSATKYENEFTHIKEFVDSVNNLTSIDASTFNFTSFGVMLDGFGDSVLLKPIRKDVLNFVCDKVSDNLTGSTTEINTAITEILTETKTMADKAEQGLVTYEQIFTDLGKIKNLTSSLETVNITRTDSGFDAIKTFGETLTELKELSVVPLIAVVRIADYITDAIVGDNGIKNIMPDNYESDAVLLEVYNTVIAEVQPIGSKYQTYLNNPDGSDFDFETDFKSIWQTVKNADQALTNAGFTR